MSETKSTGGEEPKLSAVEGIKRASRGLRGTISQELELPIDHFSEENVQLLKNHGTYQQDDRDTRTQRKKAGLDKDYKFMLRTKFPGGDITAEQYLICHDLSGKYGQADLRVTSRQCFQFHGVVRGNLRPLIHDLNLLAKIMSLGACGDVVRNTVCSPVADLDRSYANCGCDMQQLAKKISAHFLPKTSSYFDVWLDDEKVTINADGTITYASHEPSKEVEEPIYGKVYLPRKFKIGLATDFDNSIDVYTNDAGVIAVTENGKIIGYEILAGGGLGYTHRKPETYARMGTPISFVESEDEIIPILEAIVKVQRDNGGRADRRHARLKYLMDEWGVEKFTQAVHEYAGRTYLPPRNIVPSAQPDYLGWHKQMQPGLNYVGVWIENGRIRDFEGSFQFRTGLKEIISKYGPVVRLTAHHNLVLAGIRDEDVSRVQSLLDQYAIPTDKGISTLRRMEMACPSLPYCGLAMAEAERALPGMITAIENAGHGDADVIIRMSGCPNNCSRPRSAEIGIVGFGSDQYQLYVGSNHTGARLNDVLLDKVKGADLAPKISTLLDAWKHDRTTNERFGDWVQRVGFDTLKTKLGVAAS